MNIVSLILLFMLFASLIVPASFATYLVFIFPVFGATAILPPELLGNSSLTPGEGAAFFFIVKTFLSGGISQDSFRSLLNPRQLGWLGLFLFVAVAGAVILPRIFQGDISVYGLRTPWPGLVEPSAANFTQSFYLLISTLMAAAICALVPRPAFLEIVLKAALLGAGAVIATGLTDMVTNYLGMSNALSMFYTAKYGYSAGEILGARRVLGLMPEPAAYGAMAASYCALLLFIKPAFLKSSSQRAAVFLGWGCGVMAFLSTSSTAYAMMFVVVLINVFYKLHRIRPDGSIEKKSILRKTALAAGMVGAILIIALFDSNILSYFVNLVDTVVLKKNTTSSFAERSSWNAAGMNAFLRSMGFGIGVGSIRTSNFFVNILASTGLLGSALFAVFLGVVYTRHAANDDARARVFMLAAKLALTVALVGMAVAGTVPDFGIFPAIMFGVVAGLGRRRPRDAWIPPLAAKETL